MMQQKRRACDDLISRKAAEMEAKRAHLRTEEAAQLAKASKVASQKAVRITTEDVSYCPS